MSFGMPVLKRLVPMSAEAHKLVSDGVRMLWERIVAANPLADRRPLLLSYDVHPTPRGPVLFEINTNAAEC